MVDHYILTITLIKESFNGGKSIIKSQYNLSANLLSLSYNGLLSAFLKSSDILYLPNDERRQQQTQSQKRNWCEFIKYHDKNPNTSDK